VNTSCLLCCLTYGHTILYTFWSGTIALPQKTGGNKTCKRHINRYMYIHQCFRVLLFLSFTLNTFWGKGLPNTNIFLIKDIIVPDQNVYNMVWRGCVCVLIPFLIAAFIYQRPGVTYTWIAENKNHHTFHLAIVLSILRYTDSDNPFGIFKLLSL
jgi:hypothetical protein